MKKPFNKYDLPAWTEIILRVKYPEITSPSNIIETTYFEDTSENSTDDMVKIFKALLKAHAEAGDKGD